MNFKFFNSKRKELPEFWQRYEALFKKRTLLDSLATARFVVFDTETTGFNYHLDRIISIGAIDITNRELNLSNTLELYVKQDRFNEDTVEIHGIIKNERFDMMDEDTAIAQFLDYIGNAILVAHHATFDITMINQVLLRKGLPVLKNRYLDTVNLFKATRIKSNILDANNSSLDYIASVYALDVSDRHTAAGDAFLTALIFLKTTSILTSKKGLTLKKLFKL